MASESWRLKKTVAVVTFLAALLGAGSGAGCASSEIVPIAAPRSPEVLRAAQPLGADLGDIEALFHDPSAPAREELKGCDSDYRKLTSLTSSSDEVRRGTAELVRVDPVKYHWCFYSKLLDLFASMKASHFIDERQKATLDSFSFLTTVARAFMSEFRDSRYLRVSVKHYRRVSEWVFYRRLELTPKGTSELVEAENPFGFWRDQANESLVLSKYNLVPLPGPKSRYPAPVAQGADDAEEIPVAEMDLDGEQVPTVVADADAEGEAIPVAEPEQGSQPSVEIVDSDQAPETLVIEDELDKPAAPARLPAGATSARGAKAIPVAKQDLPSDEDIQVLTP